MQNLKNDPEKVLEAVLPEILSDDEFDLIQNCRSASEATWTDFVSASLVFTERSARRRGGITVNLRFCRELQELLNDYERLSVLRDVLKYGGTIKMKISAQTGHDEHASYCVHEKSLIENFRKILDEHIFNLEKRIEAYIEEGQDADYER